MMFVRMITCEGHCFNESIALEDLMVKSVLDKSQFCVSKYPGCERTTVNLLLPKTEEGGKVVRLYCSRGKNLYNISYRWK